MFYIYQDSLCNDLNKIQMAVKNIIFGISLLEISNEKLCDIRLILSELLINAYKHGNKCDENKKILLRLEVDNKKIDIQVIDEGNGIENCVYDVNDLKVDGRGLVIVKKLSDYVEIKNNSIRCVFYR